ncbi:MAG: OmpA family protein [Planctomycetia bacterium]|nr:OmpA family protein [Planctomycetia bacterium]
MAFQEDPPASLPDWFVTYGDMMSLLLTFFIMLVSMSELKTDSRVLSAVDALQKQFGNDKENVPGAARQRGAKVEAPLGPNALVQGLRPGRQVMAGGTILFDENVVAPTDDEVAKLRLIAEQFQGKAQMIEIRGHTSRRPLPKDSQLTDHWDLAFARCREVQTRLEGMGIDPKRIRLSLSAGNEPVYSGDDYLRRKANSRVEAFLLNEYASDYENADGAAPSDVKP